MARKAHPRGNANEPAGMKTNAASTTNLTVQFRMTLRVRDFMSYSRFNSAARRDRTFGLLKQDRKSKQSPNRRSPGCRDFARANLKHWFCIGPGSADRLWR